MFDLEMRIAQHIDINLHGRQQCHTRLPPTVLGCAVGGTLTDQFGIGNIQLTGIQGMVTKAVSFFEN